jgi:hypothetical protein
MSLIAEILMIAANILMSWHHAEAIKDDRPIKHGWWGLGYLALAGVVSLLNESVLLFICLLFIRKIFFDTALNLFRGKPLFYVSASTSSIIDKLHLKLFKNKSEIYIPAYLIILIILNLFL